MSARRSRPGVGVAVGFALGVAVGFGFAFAFGLGVAAGLALREGVGVAAALGAFANRPGPVLFRTVELPPTTGAGLSAAAARR